MSFDGNKMTERILDLTLEIIYLLTGEDYIVAKRSGEPVLQNSLHTSESVRKTPSPSTVPPPHSLIHERNNDQKILELTNQIIQLLTGEVPIRCEDVTVYFSMEEWEYLQGHKNFYKDVMNEAHQLISSLGGSVDRSTDAGYQSPLTVANCLQEENMRSSLTRKYPRIDDPWEVQWKSGKCEKDESTFTKVNLSDLCIPVEQSPPQITEECALSVEEHFPDTNIFTTPDHTQAEYTVTYIKEEYISDEGDFSDTDIYTLTRYAQSDYTAPHGAEKLSECEEGNFTDMNRYIPPENRQGEQASPLLSFANWQLPESNCDFFPSSSACSAQEKYFMTSADLNEHQMNNTGDKPYSCRVCGNVFTRRSNLLAHRKIHIGDKPFACPECGKCFSVHSKLHTHLKIHSGVKPFSCSECGKSFIFKSNLTEHQRIHKKENAFSCSDCGKCFTFKSNLTRHQRLHAGEKLYSCTECGKGFNRPSCLVTHRMTHTGEKPFSCSECEKRFRTHSCLIKHQRIHIGKNLYS